MHEIKNYSLRIRLQGVEIYRPENSGDYLDDFTDVFGDIKVALTKNKINSAIRRCSFSYSNLLKEEKKREEEKKE